MLQDAIPVHLQLPLVGKENGTILGIAVAINVKNHVHQVVLAVDVTGVGTKNGIMVILENGVDILMGVKVDGVRGVNSLLVLVRDENTFAGAVVVLQGLLASQRKE